MHKLLGLSVSAFLAVGACAEGASSTERHPLVFEGRIHKASADRLIEQIYRHSSEAIDLHIKSTGGDSSEAMRLGDAMLGKDINLYIAHYCHSACSQYVVPSATRTIVGPNASVLFHTSPAMLYLPDGAPRSLKQKLASVRMQERRFFERREISYESWLWLVGRIRPYCWFERSSISIDSFERYAYRLSYSSTVPSRQVLQDLGFANVEGYWPRSAYQALEDAKRVGFSARMTIAFSSELPRKAQAPSFKYTKCLNT